MSNTSIRTLILEFLDTNGATHIREMHIEILRHKPRTPEHAIRARLSEAVSHGVLRGNRPFSGPGYEITEAQESS